MTTCRETDCEVYQRCKLDCKYAIIEEDIMTSCRDVDCKHYVLEGRDWARTCTKHDLCPLEVGSTMPSLTYRLCKAREMISRDEGACAIVASQMKNWPEVSMVGLSDLAWACAQEKSYLHKNDVIGLIELLEEQWKERMS